MRASGSTTSLPILILTTETSQDKRDQGRAAGGTGWIVKPFDPEKLISRHPPRRPLSQALAQKGRAEHERPRRLQGDLFRGMLGALDRARGAVRGHRGGRPLDATGSTPCSAPSIRSRAAAGRSALRRWSRSPMPTRRCSTRSATGAVAADRAGHRRCASAPTTSSPTSSPRRAPGDATRRRLWRRREGAVRRADRGEQSDRRSTNRRWKSSTSTSRRSRSISAATARAAASDCLRHRRRSPMSREPLGNPLHAAQRTLCARQRSAAAVPRTGDAGRDHVKARASTSCPRSPISSRSASIAPGKSRWFRPTRHRSGDPRGVRVRRRQLRPRDRDGSADARRIGGAGQRLSSACGCPADAAIGCARAGRRQRRALELCRSRREAPPAPKAAPVAALAGDRRPTLERSSEPDDRRDRTRATAATACSRSASISTRSTASSTWWANW